MTSPFLESQKILENLFTASWGSISGTGRGYVRGVTGGGVVSGRGINPYQRK